MTSNASRAFSLCVASALLLGACTPAAEPEPPLRLVILHTNDIHGQAQPFPPGGGRSSPLGGLSALSALIKRERAAAEAEGAEVLVLDGGDEWQGTPEGNETFGQLVVDFFNAAGYDACVIGNHEWDFGAAIPKRIAERLEPPLLGANVRYEISGRRATWLSPSARFELQGIPVEVVGLTTAQTKAVTAAGVTDGYRFTDELTEARRVLSERGITRKGQAVVVALTHCGVERETALAEALPLLDVIVGGHSHTRIQDPKRVGEGRTLVAQAGAKAANLGRIELTIDRRTRRVLTARGALIPVLVDEVGKDPAVEAVLAKYSPDIEARMSIVVGQAPVALTTLPQRRSSSLGNAITDAMRLVSGAEVAFQNKTGIRSEIPKGPITRRSLFEVSPFGNTVMTMELTGAQLRELLELWLSKPAFGAFEVSGMVVRCDSRKPVGRRLVEVEVGGQPLDPARRYRVATSNFLAYGGDGLTVFKEGAALRDTTVTLRDAEARLIAERGGVLRADPTPRLNDLAIENP